MQSKKNRAWAAIAVGGLLATSGVAAFGPTSTATASSHREAPLISGAPQYDNTDVYAFVSPDKPDTVSLIANWIPFEEPAGGPNFYSFATDARYNINIDNDGDARPDIVYRWTFKNHYKSKNTFLYNTGPVTSLWDKDLNFRQTYTLTRWKEGQWKPHVIAKRVPVAPSFVGDASMPDYQSLRDAAVRQVRGAKSFAGQADDPFFLDLRVFDLLYGGDLSEVGDDTLAGFAVNSIALQVKTDKLTQGNDPVIGVWSTTARKDSRGKYHQVSRLGSPLVNEVVIPVGKKDRFNASRPRNDAQFAKHVTNPELPKLIEAIYGIDAPATPRNDLVQAFLTGVPGLNQPKRVQPSEQLRLNTSIPPTDDPNRLGVIGGDNAGFPNGRRLTDDVIDIELQVVEGELVGSPNDLGDAVNQNDKAFGDTFPYLALPTSGSEPNPHPEGFTPLNGGTASDTPSPDEAEVREAEVSSLAAAATGSGLLLSLAGAVALVRQRRRIAD
jgi:hypothetical protein